MNPRRRPRIRRLSAGFSVSGFAQGGMPAWWNISGLVGQCKPTMFANFGILHGSSYDQAEITIMSKDPIKTGMTGDIKLEKVWVRFFDLKNEERTFGGKGMLKLAVHDAAAGKRPMTGTIVGTKLGG